MGAAAWIWHCAGVTFAIRRCASGGDGITLSGSPSTGAPGLGTVGVEAVREQAKSPILPNHGQGEKAVGLGSGPMGADCRSDWVGDVRQTGGECVMKWFQSFGFQRRKHELQEEIDAHLQMAIADRVERGETAETARQAAAQEFGNIPLVQDVTRQMWGQGWLEQLGRDVRYALRQLRKSPGFTITATVMLAVAICANSTVFSWIDGTMLRPIPVARNTGDLVIGRAHV